MIRVALDGIESILEVGKKRAASAVGGGFNTYAQLVDEAQGLDAIESLQTHPNDDTYEKAVQILERYFGLESESQQDIDPMLLNPARHMGLHPAAPPS